MAIPKRPLPSFTLALSPPSSETNTHETLMSAVAPTITCIAGPPRDFMKTMDLRSQSSFEYQYVEELSDDEKFETQTVFGSEREGYCVIFLIFLRSLSDIWRMIVRFGDKSQRSSKRSPHKPKKGGG